MRFEFDPPSPILLIADRFYVYYVDKQLAEMSKVGLKSTPAWFLLRDPITFDDLVVNRFEREVQSMATLTHYNTVEVYDYGHTADGTFYYVMEYLPGMSLAELLRECGPLPPGRVVYLIRQVCAAREVVIVRGAVSPDHIHLLLAAPPILSPAKLAQYIKGRSSRLLQAEFAELRRQYWGQHMWARGYFCATVGAVDEQTIKAYIENQRWDEDDESFKITTPTKP